MSFLSWEHNHSGVDFHSLCKGSLELPSLCLCMHTVVSQVSQLALNTINQKSKITLPVFHCTIK